MKLQAKYMLTFFSSTLITLLVVGVVSYGLYQLNHTTNYLVTINSRILENANLYEKELAKSRRAEKEFFIFPDNPKKQTKYVGNWEASMTKITGYLDKLEDLFITERHKEMLNLVLQAKGIIAENKQE